MTNFSIDLSKHEFKSEEDMVVTGLLKIGEFAEEFQASLSYWDRRKYLIQWKEALERLFKGENSSAFVTNMYDPSTANFIFWWVMYLIGDNVHIQNHVLFLDELEGKFDETELYKFIPERETVTEEGEPISEWVVKLSDIREYLNSQ